MVEFAKSAAGHDRNQIYLVKERDERFVYLVNGVTKPLAAPKKKERKAYPDHPEPPGGGDRVSVGGGDRPYGEESNQSI